MGESSNSILTLTTPLGKDVFIVDRFEGSESINGLFSFNICVFTDKLGDDVLTLIGKSVSVELRVGSCKRTFHGIINAVNEQGATNDSESMLYVLTMVPKFWLLSLSAHNRIYEAKSAVDIVNEVVSSHGELIDAGKLGGYPKREVTTQYGESDLDFVQRLLAEEGIAYYFKHSDKSCTLTLIDKLADFPESSPSNFQLRPTVGAPAANEVAHMNSATSMATSKFHTSDYSEYTPSTTQKVTAQYGGKLSNSRHGEWYKHGTHQFGRNDDTARNLSKADSQNQTDRWLEGMEAHAATATGNGTVVVFSAGLRVVIKNVARNSTAETKYLLTSVYHRATEGHHLTTNYSNSFTCIPVTHAAGFRPDPKRTKPLLLGVHSAKVVDVKNPETPGAHGEVKVRFPWSDNSSSCWARVAQSYAGNKWGSYFVPDLNQEVLVEFINGDPDRPVVVGALYNKNNAIPPYTKTQSGIRTRSQEFNELRFDDKEGAEEVYFQAGKDYNYLVKNDETGTIKQNRSTVIESGNDGLTISSGNQSIEIEAGSQTLKVGKSITYEAMQSITLKVGGSKIKIDSTGVSIEGTLVTVKGKAQAELSGGAIAIVSGGLVKIN